MQLVPEPPAIQWRREEALGTRRPPCPVLWLFSRVTIPAHTGRPSASQPPPCSGVLGGDTVVLPEVSGNSNGLHLSRQAQDSAGEGGVHARRQDVRAVPTVLTEHILGRSYCRVEK